MESSLIFKRFKWRDKRGLIWLVELEDMDIGFRGDAKSKCDSEPTFIKVRTHQGPKQELSVARIEDLKVDSQLQDRGVGSMLVKEAISECKRRGHLGIDGSLSIVDRDHFPKLRYFYEKLGFSVVFYRRDHPDYNRPGVGKIEMSISAKPVGYIVNRSCVDPRSNT